MSMLRPPKYLLPSLTSIHSPSKYPSQPLRLCFVLYSSLSPLLPYTFPHSTPSHSLSSTHLLPQYRLPPLLPYTFLHSTPSRSLSFTHLLPQDRLPPLLPYTFFHGTPSHSLSSSHLLPQYRLSLLTSIHLPPQYSPTFPFFHPSSSTGPPPTVTSIHLPPQYSLTLPYFHPSSCTATLPPALLRTFASSTPPISLLPFNSPHSSPFHPLISLHNLQQYPLPPHYFYPSFSSINIKKEVLRLNLPDYI